LIRITMKKTKHDIAMDKLLKKVRAKARKEAKSNIRKLRQFALEGFSPFICGNFRLRCLNMGSDEGRECNEGINGSPSVVNDRGPCIWRLTRKQALPEGKKTITFQRKVEILRSNCLTAQDIAEELKSSQESVFKAIAEIKRRFEKAEERRRKNGACR